MNTTHYLPSTELHALPMWFHWLLVGSSHSSREESLGQRSDKSVKLKVHIHFSLKKGKKRKKKKEEKNLAFTVTEFNKNLGDSKRLPYCFCFGVENVILVLFLGKNKISCCYKSYAYGKMLFFNTWWLTYFRAINGIVNKHFANLKCEIWIIIKAHLSA